MTAKAYYITTLGEWQRHAARFAGSHFVALRAAGDPAAETGAGVHAAHDPAARILVLVEADEGVHISLEDDPAFEALPHPLAAKPISAAAQAALAGHGVARGANMFDAAEALARVHPLLRHRVF